MDIGIQVQYTQNSKSYHTVDIDFINVENLTTRSYPLAYSLYYNQNEVKLYQKLSKLVLNFYLYSFNFSILLKTQFLKV
jgi:hypothetical protein